MLSYFKKYCLMPFFYGTIYKQEQHVKKSHVICPNQIADSVLLNTLKCVETMSSGFEFSRV